MSEFKVGDLVSAKDEYSTATGVIKLVPEFSGIYLIDVIHAERTELGLEITSINADNSRWRGCELTLIEGPYAAMLRKHAHKKSWNTVLPKPSLEPRIGSFVKIVANIAYSHSLFIGSCGTITAIAENGDFRVCGFLSTKNCPLIEGHQWLHPNDFKVLI